MHKNNIKWQPVAMVTKIQLKINRKHYNPPVKKYIRSVVTRKSIFWV